MSVRTEASAESSVQVSFQKNGTDDHVAAAIQHRFGVQVKGPRLTPASDAAEALDHVFGNKGIRSVDLLPIGGKIDVQSLTTSGLHGRRD